MSRGSGPNLLENTELVSSMIGLIYDAAGAPEFYPQLLERLSTVLELNAATLGVDLFLNEDGTARIPPITIGSGSETFNAYDENVAAVDPFIDPLMDLVESAVVPFDRLVPDDAFVRGAFYNDFYATTGNRRGFVSVFHRDADTSSVLFGHRAPDQPNWTDAELSFIRVLTPHLRRARALGERLGTLTSDEGIVDGVLDRLTLGIVFVDASGQFIRANARGEQTLREQDGLGLTRGRLVADRAATTQALDAIVAAACATGRHQTHSAPLSLRIDRPSGRRSLEVMACPIDRDSEVWSHGQAAAFIVLNDGDAELRGVAQRLRDLHGLTDAEAMLTAALAGGMTVREWAEHRGISVETVRWQLKQVFQKTGVSRQSDLMRLVLLGPAVVR